MRVETLKALSDYIDKVNELAAGVLLQTGIDTYTNLRIAAENLKLELENEVVE